MKTLNAIADLHAENLIHIGLRSVFLFDPVVKMVEGEFYGKVADSSKLYDGSLIKELIAYSDRCAPSKESASTCKKLLEGAQEIINRIQSEISKGYLRVYLEGQGGIFYDDFLRRGIEVVLLDKNNPFYPDKNQKYRERIWAGRICSFNSFDNSLLIAGGDHIRNKHGLVDILKKRNLAVNVVLDNRDMHTILGQELSNYTSFVNRLKDLKNKSSWHPIGDNETI